MNRPTRSSHLKKKGFTLLEVMVVISITLILSGIVLTYNRNSESQLLVHREQSVIVGMLNRSKSLALEKYRSPDDNFETCAFGINLMPPRSVTLFQDLGLGGCKSSEISEVVSRYRLSQTDRPEVLETYELSNKVIMLGLPEGGVDLVFIPPDLIATSTISTFPIKFSIESTDGEYGTEVSISSVGQIISN